MSSEQDELYNPGSPQSRLRLKKNYKESIDDKAHLSGNSNSECREDDLACIYQAPQDDDSIIDFKSPKKIHSVQLKDTNSNKLSNKDKSKKKVPCAKIKIINNRKNPESSRPNRKIDRQQQSSIESSFFKNEKKVDAQNLIDIKTAYVCPLCLKNLKDENSQSVHMKSCAIKNNVSTKKLLNAVELQERQAAERKSLGLLTAPILQEKKKPVPRKIASNDDPDLQLALALSKSLYEKEKMEMLNEIEIVTNLLLLDSNKECSQGTTLQSFGFTNSRNISPTNNHSSNKMKRKKLIASTILQKRTTAERERILTERIAEILMNDIDFTQKSQTEKEQFDSVKKKIVIKNQLLQELHQVEATLWDRTSLVSAGDVFYVKQLSPQITPLPKKEILNVENENTLKKEEIEMKQSIEIQPMEIQSVEEESTIYLNAAKTCCEEKRFLGALAINWGNILNDSSASDIIVLVKNNGHIWTHKLVFYVRCTNILLDVVSNDTEFSTAKEKICWLHVDYDVALAFLEFVYCGIIRKYSKIFDSDTSLSNIRSLARKYKMNDLFTYLRQKESKPNLTEIKHDYDTYEKSAENAKTNMKEAASTSKLDKLTLNTSSNYAHENSENNQCSQKALSEIDANDILQSAEANYVPVKNSCDLQDQRAALIKSSEKVCSKSNAFIKRETNVSPDMFDDTLNVTRIMNKSADDSLDHGDENIRMLLSLFKQDVDTNICSQESLTRKCDAEDSKPAEDVSISENAEQSIMEISSDSDSDHLKLSTSGSHKNSSIDNTQSNKLKSIQYRSSNIAKMERNLALFVEKVQRANENSTLDSDLDIMTHSVQMSPLRYLNPFHVNRHDNSDNGDSRPYDDNTEQSANTKKKLGKLSIIEQRLQSYIEKNPKFYSHSSNERIWDIKQTNTLQVDPTLPKKKTVFSRDNTDIYTQNSPEKIVDTSEIVATPACSSCTKTTNQTLNESICDLEVDDEDISMYSEYMKNHQDNSIAKYRPAIKRSDSNLFDESTSFDSPNRNSSVDEMNDEALTRTTLTQKDAEIVSDTEIESVSSNVSCSIVLPYDNADHKDAVSSFTQQPKKPIESDKRDADSDKSHQLFQVDEISKVTRTSLKNKENINNTAKSNRSNCSDRETISDNEDIDTLFTQTKLRESHEKKIDEHDERASNSSPIMVFSSPEYFNTENSLSDMERYSKHTMETNACTSRKSEFSFNLETDIYIANVDVDKYEKRHFLEKSQSASVLSTTTFNVNTRRRGNKRNRECNANDSATDGDAPVRANIDRNAVSLTNNSASIRKLGRKSLSEGQININGLRNQQAESRPAQLQCNYSQNIGNVEIAKIIEKDVTPPPDYNSMETPKLHKMLKKYGLKAQNRSKAVKLLTYIYGELHPLISATEIRKKRKELTGASSDEDESPPLKKSNINDNNTEDSDNELSCSQDSNASVNSVKGIINKEMEFYEIESLSALENSLDVREAFTKLIKVDKDLHNAILQYEPLNIEQLHVTLRERGFKCKLPDLMSFLDEQCITFYAPEQSVRSRTRRKM